MLEIFPYSFFKFNPNEEAFASVLRRTIEMRDQTLEFFKNAGLSAENGILFETLNLLSDPKKLLQDNLRIEESLKIFYQPGFKDQFGEICISNKFPTDAEIGTTTACEAAKHWRMDYNATSFDAESLGVEKPDHRELKNLILHHDKKFYAFIGTEEAPYDHSFKLAHTKYLESHAIIPYTLNPGTITMFDGSRDVHLSGLIIDESLRQGGVNFLTNNCGSRFLSSCVRIEPLIMVVEKIQNNIARGLSPLPEMRPTGYKGLLMGDHFKHNG